jgi:hypothetical protein
LQQQYNFYHQYVYNYFCRTYDVNYYQYSNYNADSNLDDNHCSSNYDNDYSSTNNYNYFYCCTDDNVYINIYDFDHFDNYSVANNVYFNVDFDDYCSPNDFNQYDYTNNDNNKHNNKPA